MLLARSDLDVGDDVPFQKRPAVRKVSPSRRTARRKDQRKLDHKCTSSPNLVNRSEGEE